MHDCLKVAEAITVHGLQTLRIAGSSYRLDLPQHRQESVVLLARVIYSDLYCRIPTVEERSLATDEESWSRIARFLADRYRTSGTVIQLGPQGEVVVDFGLRRQTVVTLHELTPGGAEDLPIRVGSRVHFNTRQVRWLDTEGFWHVWSDVQPLQGNKVRLYFSVTLGGMAEILPRLVSWVDRLGMPYMLKGATPGHHLRADNMVLYIPQDWADRIVFVARSIRDECPDAFWPFSPLFTARIAPGLSLAEDPEQWSFGQVRSWLCAKATVNWLTSGQAGELAAALSAEFQAAALHADEWFRNPGRPYHYSFSYRQVDGGS